MGTVGKFGQVATNGEGALAKKTFAVDSNQYNVHNIKGVVVVHYNL